LIPTTTPAPSPDVVSVPGNPEGIVYVIPEIKTPSKVTYDVDLEVGRLAHIVPEKKINKIKKSSDTNIINDPRSATGSFDVEYEARANNPGDATLTFYNEADAFTEEWNVHVFCRPLDFEKDEYIVEKPEGRDGYITLFLKYFEYEFEYAYAFEWESSNKDVAYNAGGDQLSTYCRFCIKNPGVTIITVKDKYGNSSKCALVVKDPASSKKTDTEPEITPTPTPVPDIDNNNQEENKDNESSYISTLSAKKQKKLVKASGIDLSLNMGNGKIVLKWTSDSETDLELDGYQVQLKALGSKKFKTKKTIKNGNKTSWKYTKGKAYRSYVFRVRGYKLINGKKVYTKWSEQGTSMFVKS